MQSTKQLLDKAKKAQGIESDYKLAQALGVVQTAVTNWRSGRSHPDDVRAAQLAEMAGQDPSSVIAELHAARAKTPEVRALWLRMAQQLRHAVALVMMACGVALLLVAPNPQGAQASTLPHHENGPASVYYVKCRTRRILREIAAFCRGAARAFLPVLSLRYVADYAGLPNKNERPARHALAVSRAPLPAGA